MMDYLIKFDDLRLSHMEEIERFARNGRMRWEESGQKTSEL